MSGPPNSNRPLWIASGHTGVAPGALTAFGNALHSTTDAISPSHAGYQPWYGLVNWHSPIHGAREQTINQAQMNAAVNAAHSAFRQTFGDYLYFLAIQAPPPPQPRPLKPKVKSKIKYLQDSQDPEQE
jgi:hypothetical protein